MPKNAFPLPSAHSSGAGVPSRLAPLPTPVVYQPRPTFWTGLSTKESFQRVLAFLGGGIFTGVVGYYIYKLYKNQNISTTLSLESIQDEFEAQSKASSHSSEKNVQSKSKQSAKKVLLHQCARGYFVPSITPFSLQLETFLRMAKIPYELSLQCESLEKNSTWITVGSDAIKNSSDCIPFLCKAFGIDLEKRAKSSRKTAARLVEIMLQNHIHWGIALWRWVFDGGRSLTLIQPKGSITEDSFLEISESVTKSSWYHGMGRHSPNEVRDMMNKDISDLSACLGRHKFILGENPGEVDCLAFSLLGQMFWNMPGSHYSEEIQKYPNLLDYLFRIRDAYFPDWEDLLQKRGEDADVLDLLSNFDSESMLLNGNKSQIPEEGEEEEEAEFEAEKSSRAEVTQSKSNWAEDNSYYDGVTSDGSKSNMTHITSSIGSLNSTQSSPFEVDKHDDTKSYISVFSSHPGIGMDEEQSQYSFGISLGEQSDQMSAITGFEYDENENIEYTTRDGKKETESGASQPQSPQFPTFNFNYQKPQIHNLQHSQSFPAQNAYHYDATAPWPLPSRFPKRIDIQNIKK